MTKRLDQNVAPEGSKMPPSALPICKLLEDMRANPSADWKIRDIETLKGCMSDGDTPEEALANAQEAVLEWIEESKAMHRDIPEPGSAGIRAQRERDALLRKIQDQSSAMESMNKDIRKFESDISVLRETLLSLTEGLSGDFQMWGSFVPGRLVGCDPDEIVH